MYLPVAEQRPDRYRVAVEEYASYWRNGYLIVRGLVAPDEAEELREFTADVLCGRTILPGLAPPPENATDEERFGRFSRIHMLHRALPIGERYLLHPRILDVLEALIGSDVLALQTMLFLNPPGYGGQGWHQDSNPIPTYPDTLIGTWLALDRADEENGCLEVVPGSNCEPVSYPASGGHGRVHADGVFQDLPVVGGGGYGADSGDAMSAIVSKYAESMRVVVEPGDVLFFHGHILHRSYANRSPSRFRRAFVSHYCNARSWVPWNHGQSFEGDCGNYLHILARGHTHLPFARPRFGTACAALEIEPAAPTPEMEPEMVDAFAESNGRVVFDPFADRRH